MKKHILGVIGGLGPAATTRFMELVIEMTDASSDQENVDMIVYNFPSIPDRTGYILGCNLKSPLPGLLSVGQALARQGADWVAIPCMTAHYFYPQLAAGIPVPVIHAIDETTAHLKSLGITRAGILGTDGTIQSGIFSASLRAAGITPLIPEPARQAQVMELIYHDIKAGYPADMTKFRSAERSLRRQGAQVIILGCTELSLIKRDRDIGPGFLDAMEVLARQSILRCGKKLKPQYETLVTKR